MTVEETENLKFVEESQKRVEYYAASVNAWFNTSLEHDKSLLALSAGGIGLLLTLLTTVGLSSAEALVLYIGAITSFVVALVSILVIFRHNRTHIEDILSGNPTSNGPLLTKLDATALWAFAIGVLFTAIIGIAAAIHSYSTKEINMSNENVKRTTGFAMDSFDGASRLQSPTNLAQKSFNNAAILQPQSAASTAAPAVSPPAPAASGSLQKANNK